MTINSTLLELSNDLAAAREKVSALELQYALELLRVARIALRMETEGANPESEGTNPESEGTSPEITPSENCAAPDSALMDFIFGYYAAKYNKHPDQLMVSK
ncbi:hypothetical protein BJ138DRAFT_1121150 [Hygrophoropsis aurantiaca]|uniref:Uncharacterized protein n=1 Tax=Hygrophoropsis aurantiaca TaxID=72124 RepID=A0ACB7ZNI9_9AGAM|nr:hypothetical protein BJ138DRAFT_1121150 [Hygrophoropsis aurantiaca]